MKSELTEQQQAPPRLKRVNWNSNDDEEMDQDDEPGMLRTRTQPQKDIHREFSKLHQKIMENKLKRQQPAGSLAVPHSRDYLVLKYGPVPNRRVGKSSMSEDMPSYKKDAMRLIMNRINRYIGNVFHEMQIKVMRDDVMKQRREIYELSKGSGRNRKINFNNVKDNDLNALNNQKIEVNQPKPRSNFRELFEQKKKKIQDSYNQYHNREIPQTYAVETNQSKDDNTASLYETPDKEDVFTSYDQNEKEKNQNNEEMKMPYFKENAFESVHTQKQENNRYNSEEDEDEELNNRSNEQSQPFNDTSDVQAIQQQIQKVQPIMIMKENSPIKETDQSHEYSHDENSITTDLRKQPEIEIIQPPIKKEIASYLNRDSQDVTPKNKGPAMFKIQRPQDMVEMSFNGNPFDRRPSQQMNNSNSTVREQSTGNHSPDFKRSQNQESLKVYSGLQGSLQSLNKGNNSISNGQSKNDSIELSQNKIEQQQQKPKITDKIKEMMNEFDSSKNVNQEQLKVLNEEQVIETKEEKIQKLSQKLNKNQSSSGLSQLSKISELKKKLGLEAQKSDNNELNNQTQKLDANSEQISESLQSSSKTIVQNVIKITSKKQTMQTKMGKMIKISENTVMFQESRKEMIEKQQQNYANVFKVKSKKKQQQQLQNSQVSSQKAQIDQKQQEQVSQIIKNEQKVQLYKKISEKLFKILDGLYEDQMRKVLMELTLHQINNQKANFVVKVRNKFLLRRSMKQLQVLSQKSKCVDLLQAFAKKQDQIIEKKLQKLFLQWKLSVQLHKEQQIIKQKELQGSQMNNLSQLIKLKKQQNLRYAFEQIKTYNTLVIKQQKEQSQKRSVQAICNYLQKKYLKTLNKKFQKFRKLLFLIEFDRKLAALTRILNNKIDQNKKESFKEIVNYCIRNDPYKKQVELLNSQYQSHKMKIVDKQLQRVCKILRQQLLKDGFIEIKQYVNDLQERDKALKRLLSIVSKNFNDQRNSVLQQAFKELQKHAMQKAKLQEQKQLACKKLKLMLAVAGNKMLKVCFDNWKSETENYINMEEYTQLNSMKEQQRNSVLEQMLIDIQWSTISKAFNMIKRRASIVKKLENIVKDQEQKRLKIMRNDMFNRWKNYIYKLKLVKMNLIVVLKGVDKREKNELMSSFKKWKLHTKSSKIKEEKVYQLLQAYEEKIGQSYKQKMIESYQLWKQIYEEDRQRRQELKRIISRMINKQMALYFNEWKTKVEVTKSIENKALSFLDLLSKVMLHINFRKFKRNTEEKHQKLQGVQKLAEFYAHKEKLNYQDCFNEISGYSRERKQKLKKQYESLKIMKRIIKNTNFKAEQRALLQWKLLAINSNVKTQQQKIKSQYQSRVLATVLAKTKQRALQIGFKELKQFCQKSQEKYLKSSLRQRSIVLFTEKLNTLYLQRLKQTFSLLQQYYLQKAQDSKVQYAISKLSSVSKLYEIMETHRPDRECFYKWKNETLKSQAYELGLHILDGFFLTKIKSYLDLINAQSKALQIQKTKKKIGLNTLSVVLFKQEKNQLEEGFLALQEFSQQAQNYSKQNKKYNQLPPKASASQSVERPTQKNDIAISQPIIFKSNIKNHSSNSSVVSQKNMRYSQKDEDEDEQYDDYEKIMIADNDISTDQVPIVKAKISMGGNKRESLWSYHSNGNNRYKEDKYDEDDEDFKIPEAPMTSKHNNDPVQINLFSFLKDEKIREEQAKTEEDEPKTELLIKEEKKEESKIKHKKIGSTKGTKKAQSRNTKSHLNKYLSLNSTQSNKSQKSQKSAATTNKKSKQGQIPVVSFEASHTTIKDDNTDTKSQAQLSQPSEIYIQSNEYYDQLQPDMSASSSVKYQQDFPQRYDAKQYESNKSSQSQSRIFGTRALELEPVPEEEQEVLQTQRSHSKKSSTTNQKKSSQSKLSNFLNCKSNQPTKKDSKTAKQKSIENNEKFKVFLVKGKQNQSQVMKVPKNNDSKIESSMLKYTQQNLEKYSVFEPQIAHGVHRLETFFIKKSMENIIKAAFSEENDRRYMMRMKDKQINVIYQNYNLKQKIKRVLEIRKQMAERDQFLKQEAFLIWKRSDYMMMLESLQNFKKTLNKIYKDKNL